MTRRNILIQLLLVLLVIMGYQAYQKYKQQRTIDQKLDHAGCDTCSFLKQDLAEKVKQREKQTKLEN